MRSHADGSVIIQTSSYSELCPPPWFGEVALLASYLRKQGIFAAISEHVRFARRRMGAYQVIDFLAVQIALRQKFRTHPGGVLPAAGSFCRAVYGLVRPHAVARALYEETAF